MGSGVLGLADGEAGRGGADGEGAGDALCDEDAEHLKEADGVAVGGPDSERGWLYGGHLPSAAG